jgi:hypothetical protein
MPMELGSGREESLNERVRSNTAEEEGWTYADQWHFCSDPWRQANDRGEGTVRRVAGLTASLALLIAIAGAVPAGAVSKAQLRAKALSLSNFPIGWSVDSSTSGGAVSRPACLQGFTSSFPHEVKVTVAYTHGSSPALQETLESGPGIDARYAAFKKELDGCKEIRLTSGGQTISGTVGAMSFPPVGSRSSAWAMTLTTQGVTVGVDLVLFQAGPIIGDVVYEDPSTPDTVELQVFVTEAVNKIEGKGTIPPRTI